MKKPIDQVRALAAPIKAKIEEIADKIADLKADLQAEYARLENVQRKCDHPNGYKTSSMGDPGFHCPDCGYTT